MLERKPVGATGYYGKGGREAVLKTTTNSLLASAPLTTECNIQPGNVRTRSYSAKYSRPNCACPHSASNQVRAACP